MLTHNTNKSINTDSFDDNLFNRLKSFLSLNVTLGLLLLLIILAFAPAYADNQTSDEAQREQSAQNSSSTQSNSDPDNLLEYTQQQLADLRKEGIDFPDSAKEVFDGDEEDKVDQSGQLQADSGLTGDYNESYYALKSLNRHLSALPNPPNLATPLSTLEFFQSAIIKERYDLAAYALNMNLLDNNSESSDSAELAKRLDFLLNNQDLYVFEDMPDRADGLIEPPVGSSSSINGIPRRSIKLGFINYRNRQVPIFIERVRVKDEAPVWVFSAQTVGNIDNLYEQYKPPEFAQYLPSWLTLRFFGMAVWS